MIIIFYNPITGFLYPKVLKLLKQRISVTTGSLDWLCCAQLNLGKPGKKIMLYLEYDTDTNAPRNRAETKK